METTVPGGKRDIASVAADADIFGFFRIERVCTLDDGVNLWGGDFEIQHSTAAQKEAEVRIKWTTMTMIST